MLLLQLLGNYFKDAIAKQEKKVTEINDIISTGPIYVVEEFNLHKN